MKLYVCYGTWTRAPRPGGHPCGNADRALREAGHDPEVVKAYGLGMLPGIFNRTSGRQEVKRKTGSYMVPMLETDDGQVVLGSQEIVDWAKAPPASAGAATA